MSKLHEYKYIGEQDRVIPTLGRCVKGSIKLLTIDEGNSLVKQGLFVKVTSTKKAKED